MTEFQEWCYSEMAFYGGPTEDAPEHYRVRWLMACHEAWKNGNPHGVTVPPVTP